MSSEVKPMSVAMLTACQCQAHHSHIWLQYLNNSYFCNFNKWFTGGDFIGLSIILLKANMRIKPSVHSTLLSRCQTLVV